jgi:hypothetical protein
LDSLKQKQKGMEKTHVELIPVLLQLELLAGAASAGDDLCLCGELVSLSTGPIEFFLCRSMRSSVLLVLADPGR